MPEPAIKPATFADIDAIPEGTPVHAEVVAGELFLSPRPKPRHNRAQGGLYAALYGPSDLGIGGPGGWWILLETYIELAPHDCYAPDLASWRRERVPDFPEDWPIRVVPDWICEVLSRWTRLRDRTVKMDRYLASGVEHLWFVDPSMHMVEAFAAEGGRWVRLGGWTDGDVVAIPPFDATPIDVGLLFPPARGPDLVNDAEGAPPG